MVVAIYMALDHFVRFQKRIQIPWFDEYEVAILYTSRTAKWQRAVSEYTWYLAEYLTATPICHCSGVFIHVVPDTFVQVNCFETTICWCSATSRGRSAYSFCIISYLRQILRVRWIVVIRTKLWVLFKCSPLLNSLYAHSRENAITYVQIYYTLQRKLYEIQRVSLWRRRRTATLV